MKHRKNKIKSQHGMIKGLRKFLEKEISSQDFIKGIIPGRIDVGKATGEVLKVSYQYKTEAGAKLIARSGSSIQEIFVTTDAPESLEKIIEAYNQEN